MDPPCRTRSNRTPRFVPPGDAATDPVGTAADRARLTWASELVIDALRDATGEVMACHADAHARRHAQSRYSWDGVGVEPLDWLTARLHKLTDRLADANTMSAETDDSP